MDQIVNNAAKWHYMFGGQQSIPLVIRMVLGRGWGQGPQHSQSLQAWFAHIPGLKVVMPATASDAKGLLLASIADENPVIFLEHRWLHNLTSLVPDVMEPIPLGKAHVARPGRDVTFVCTSYMTLEALRAAEFLAEVGVEAEVVDVRTIRPLDTETILASVRRTGRLIIGDTGTTFCGVSAEIAALACEQAFGSLRCAPRRLASPESPSPSTPALAADYYPRALHLAQAAVEMLELPHASSLPYHKLEPTSPLDVPDRFFSGPF
jgi:pyruvate dehydrogenase E1 component beta subunit